MNNGNELHYDYHEQLVESIGKYYTPLRFFGTIFFAMSSIGMIGFLIGFFVEDVYSEGLFAVLPVFKWSMFILSVLFIGGLVFTTFQLMMLPIRKIRAVKNREFFWRYGQLTDKTRYQNQGRIWVDGEVCLCLGLTIQEFDVAQIGDEFLVIYLGNSKNPLRFALKIQRYSKENHNFLEYTFENDLRNYIDTKNEEITSDLKKMLSE